MQVSDPNNVKIYNLSAGKSLPEVRILFSTDNLFLTFLYSGFQKEKEEPFLKKMWISDVALNSFKISICLV